MAGVVFPLIGALCDVTKGLISKHVRFQACTLQAEQIKDEL